MPSTLDDLGAALYVRLTTYRRDGRAVGARLPVVRDGDALAVWAGMMSGSARRVRGRGDVLVCPCDRWGQPTGPQVPGRATFLDLEGKQRVVALLRRKYGLLRWIIVYSGHATRGRGSHTVIRVTLL